MLFITGWGRSGTTILDRILGQIEGFFAVGELRYIWDRNLIENRLCGCGAAFNDCEIWQNIMSRAFGDRSGIVPQEMVRMRESHFRSRHFPLLLTKWGRDRIRTSLRDYTENLSKLYSAIREVTECRVITDSSKFPSHGYVLGMIPSIELYVVHIIRDPRAVAYSWSKPKLQPDTGEMAPMKKIGLVKSSLLWSLWNIVGEILWSGDSSHYYQIRYEDFVINPRTTVDKILEMMNQTELQTPFISENEVMLGINHTVSGNPNRFDTGKIEIKSDNRWRESMVSSKKTLARALTYPVCLKYRY